MTSLYNRVQYHLGLTPDDSDKNRVKYIYELIVTNTEYDNEFSEIVNKYNEKINSNALKENEEDKEDFSEEELSVLYKYQSTAYGALCYKNAICGGYTAAIGLLLNEKGIVNGVCYGLRENKYYHIWNIVKIGNNYFHLDSTNEKPLDGKSPDWMVYEYFLCSDSVMRKNYEFLSTAYTAPACNDKSLYIYNKTTCKITAARDFSFELYQSLVTEAVKADVHVITFVASYPISTMAVSSFYYEYYNKTFFVNGIAPKLSTTYYHSPDYKTVNFYISY